MNRFLFAWFFFVALGCQTAPTPFKDGADGVTLLQRMAGDVRIDQVHFTLEEHFHPGVGELLYPELGSHFIARSGYDFRAGTGWQLSNGTLGPVWWSWNGRALETRRSGREYTPIGIDRSLHVRTLMWLLRPAQAALMADDVDIVRIPPRDGRPRVLVRERTGARNDHVLEADPNTLKVLAVEYTIRELRLPLWLRREYDEETVVAPGVTLPFRMTEAAMLPSGSVVFYKLALSNVTVGVTAARP